MISPQEAFDYFRSQGYAPHQAAAIVGNMRAESRFDPTITGDRGTAYGAMQWRGSRQADLDRFAAERGGTRADPKIQLAFYDWELRNTEKRAGERLRAAKDLTEATNAVVSSLRPGGYTAANPAGSMHYDRRMAYAQSVLGGAPPGGSAVAAAPPPEAPAGPPMAPPGGGMGSARNDALLAQGRAMLDQAAGGKPTAVAGAPPEVNTPAPAQAFNPYRKKQQPRVMAQMPTMAGLLGGPNG